MNYLSGNNKISKEAKLVGVNYVENATLGKCEIYGSKITNSIVCDGAVIINSVLENCVVRQNVRVGPFAYLRQNAFIEQDCRIGDFVEVKNSLLERGVKAAHHAYIGDAYVGENTNVGCGTVFANYNGKIKQKTYVGKNTFIGANTNLVAPVDIGNNCFIGAGTTIRKNLEDNTFFVGVMEEKTKKINNE